ncbi:MAG: MFS transporter [Deltaproteobacteria bacterium]|nr:MFS transporter [Deltaproteobacteria bacterium]
MSERDRFRWAILALISVSHIMGAAAQYGISTLAPFYQQDLQLSRAQVGLFFSAFYLGMAGLSIAAGWLADRLGVRATTLNGHLVLGVCTAAAALAPSFAWAFGFFFLAGLGYSFLNPASTKGVMAWFHRDERATAMGIKQTGVPAGGVVAALLGPSLVMFAGWRAALAGLGIINLLFGFIFWACWREPAGEVVKADSSQLSIQPGKGALNVYTLLCVSFGTALFLVAQMSLITYVPLYLKDVMGFSSYRASQALALTQAGAMAGRIGWGIVSDRLFRGRRKSVLLIIGFLSTIITVGLSLVLPGSSLFTILPLIFIAGLCMVGYQGVSYALIGEIAGKDRTGMALGLVITVNSIGAIFGTPLFGYLVDATASYAIGWQVLAGIMLLGTVALVFFLQEPHSD